VTIKKINHAKNSVIFMAFAMMASEPAMAGGLSKAKGIMDQFKTELLTIIPIIAVIALILLGIGYATKHVEKSTFIRWAIGIIIAGSSAEITALFFT
jgi:hypothetical protein